MRAVLLAALLVAACSRAQPSGGNGQTGPVGTLEGNRQGGPAAPPAGGDDACRPGYDCADLAPAERMRGVWVTGFERSAFVPNATAAPAYGDPAPDRIWLDFADGSPPDPALRAELDKMGTTAAVALEFIGRRSRGPGNFGHMGGAREMVRVERIISARIIGPIRREPD